MFEHDALVAQLDEPYTNQVVSRFNRFAFIRDEWSSDRKSAEADQHMPYQI